MSHITTALEIAVLGYVGYILMAPTPIATLDRLCEPAFIWPEKALVAGAKLAAPQAETGITQSFTSGFGRCRAWAWDVFYESKYEKEQQQARAAAAQAAAAKEAKAAPASQGRSPASGK